MDILRNICQEEEEERLLWQINNNTMLYMISFATETPINSFPLTLWVKAACLVLAIEVLLHARVLTLICACPIILATINFQMQIWDISKGF